MPRNEHAPAVIPMSSKHPGHWDNQGQPIRPGDLVVVSDRHFGTREAIITRFTPARAYFVYTWYNEADETEMKYWHLKEWPCQHTWDRPSKILKMKRMVKL